MYKFDFGVSDSFNPTAVPRDGLSIGRRCGQAMLFMLIGAAGAAQATTANTTFFYDLLSPQQRLESSLSSLANVSVFEQTRKAASPLAFPVAPFAMPGAAEQATLDTSTVIEHDDGKMTLSEERLFDSVTLVFDAAEETGLHEVLAAAISHLTARGASVIESCSGAECGDSQRWNKRFGLYAAGPEDQQAYHRLAISASSTGPNRFVSDIFEVYATRLGCCVRLAVSHHRPNAHQYHVQKNGSLDPLAFPLETFSIYFDSGKFELADAQKQSLSKQLSSLNACTQGRRILLEGHTDAQGDSLTNRVLSERRVANVRASLSAAGIPDDCLVTAAYGDTTPSSRLAAEQRKVIVRVLLASWEMSSEPSGQQSPSTAFLISDEASALETE